MGVLGAKTIRLNELKKLGLNVPKFATIDNKEILTSTGEKIHAQLGCKSYAVRSSALIEDSKNQSYAGQFETKLNVSPDELASAITEVVNQAKVFLKGDLAKFSLIIQEFIEPDFAGVTFTRNPLGGREMVIEYHAGRGEDLVSGKIKPAKMGFYWIQEGIKSPLPKLDDAIKSFKKIERNYKFPQDIEWCIKDGEWFFLQTRPITTISDYEESLYLDANLPKNGKFHFEKTEISEIAPRPTQITKDLLEHIYSDTGPIKKVYAKYGVAYESKDILKILGNELFIDREQERETLLPRKGLFRSIKNTLKLGKIPLDGYQEIAERLKEKIEKRQEYSTDLVDAFMQDYELVFEVNLLTSYAFKKLEIALGNDKGKVAEILSGNTGIAFDIKFDTSGLRGNALEVADESKFVSNVAKTSGDNQEGPGKYAIIYNQLREFSRWLVVKNINLLRGRLFDVAEKHNFKNKKLIYFAKLQEIIGGKVSEDECKKRAEEYEKFAGFTMPNKLTNQPITESEELITVSVGDAEGILVDQVKNDGSKQILYTQNLEPSLTKYFGKIEGIVSEHGSLLSHLAIIAREEKLPVIVNFSLQKSGLKIGDRVKMSNDPTVVSNS